MGKIYIINLYLFVVEGYFLLFNYGCNCMEIVVFVY